MILRLNKKKVLEKAPEKKREINPRQKQMVLAVIAITLAIVIGFAAYPYITANQQVRVDVVTAKTDIPADTQITDGMLTIRAVMQADLPSQPVLKKEEVVGWYTTGKVFGGDILTQEKVTDTIQVVNTNIADATAKGYKVISLTLPDLASSVSGKIQPGDLVSILSIQQTQPTATLMPAVTAEPSDNASASPTTSTSPVPTASIESQSPSMVGAAAQLEQAYLDDSLRYVEVCALSTGTGADAKTMAVASGSGTSNSTTDSKNNIPATISLYVIDAQALKLLEINKGGTLHVIFVARGQDRLQYMDAAHLVKGVAQ
jgi:pilus assembly protein CpaB